LDEIGLNLLKNENQAASGLTESGFFIDSSSNFLYLFNASPPSLINWGMLWKLWK
jgi:hypothetical protein